MRKSYQSKGQWFIISAVMVSAAFLVISSFLATYSEVDSSRSATINEDFIYKNVREQFQRVVTNSPCENLSTNLREFKYFAEKTVGEMGYLLVINYTEPACPSKYVEMGLLIGSDKMIVYEGLNASEVIPGFEY